MASRFVCMGGLNYAVAHNFPARMYEPCTTSCSDTPFSIILHVHVYMPYGCFVPCFWCSHMHLKLETLRSLCKVLEQKIWFERCERVVCSCKQQACNDLHVCLNKIFLMPRNIHLRSCEGTAPTTGSVHHRICNYITL